MAFFGWIGLDKDALTLLCSVKKGCTELTFLLENDAQRPWIWMAGLLVLLRGAALMAIANIRI